MIDPKVALIIMALYGAVWVGGKVVHGIHEGRVKVEHVVKETGKKIGHGLGRLVGKHST